MSTIIYHNPRCSKSRQALEILQNRANETEVIEYLSTPPTVSELKSILAMLGISARDLIRKAETEYQQLGLSDPDLTELQIIEALVSTPKLIERPIVVANGKAVIGRPPEKILEIL